MADKTTINPHQSTPSSPSEKHNTPAFNKTGLYALHTVFGLLFLATLTVQAEVSTNRVAFYNVENLFDCQDDSLTMDEEFLPAGLRGWTPAKFRKKTANISRVIAGMAFPALVGLAEVENEAVLTSLTKFAPLKQAGYQFIHYDSPDARGIDVALLYNPYLFQPVYSTPCRIHYPFDSLKSTRDLLYVKGLLYNVDTLHVFVCHMPSRLGGEAASRPYRCYVAAQLKKRTDSIQSLNAKALILVMGDFNDSPSDASLELICGPVSDQQRALVNLMKTLPEREGTHKFESEWTKLDQILVSGALYARVVLTLVFKPDYLLMSDEKWFGVKPFRTFNGMKWQGGYSDHLPVFTDLKTND